MSRRKSAANGALMRTCVVGLAGERVEEQAEAICKLTHYDSRCVGSCVIVSCIIHNLVYLDRQLSYDEISSLGNKYDGCIAEWIDMAYNSSDISLLDLDECHSMGYPLRALSAALWCYWHAESFENGLLTVVNEGGDADSKLLLPLPSLEPNSAPEPSRATIPPSSTTENHTELNLSSSSTGYSMMKAYMNICCIRNRDKINVLNYRFFVNSSFLLRILSKCRSNAF